MTTKAMATESQSCGSSETSGKFTEACKVNDSFMKGVDFYTWREHQKWSFALVPGKNSLHDASELKAAKVSSVDELRSRLKKLHAENHIDQIPWNTNSTVNGMKLKQPPDVVIQEIEKAFQEAQIKLIRE